MRQRLASDEGENNAEVEPTTTQKCFAGEEHFYTLNAPFAESNSAYLLNGLVGRREQSAGHRR